LNANENNSTLLNSIQYLIDFKENNKVWSDPSVVGTGHPEIIYMDYAAYPFVWTTQAISLFLKNYRN